jgi:hypothetical protein
MRKLIATDKDGFYRDLETGGLVNMSQKDYAEFQKRKVIKKELMQQEKTKEERINKLENDVSELKSGISQILEILKNGNN